MRDFYNWPTIFIGLLILWATGVMDDPAPKPSCLSTSVHTKG